MSRRAKCRACRRRRKDIGGMCIECGWNFRAFAHVFLDLEVFRHGVRDDGQTLAWVSESVNLDKPEVAVAFDAWVSQRAVSP